MSSGVLRLPILLNAGFSCVSGVVMAFDAPRISEWLGPRADSIYFALGIGLALFSCLLFAITMRPTALKVLAVSIADVAWIVVTFATLIIFSEHFSSLGAVALTTVNAVVLGLAWLQYRSILSAFRTPDCKADEFEVCISVEAPVAAPDLWTVVANISEIKRFMPSLKSSALTVGAVPGVGSVRTCENLGGQVWSEKCYSWDEGKSFSVEFLTDEPGFPYPFSSMVGGWRIAPNNVGSRVEVWWRVVPSRPWTAAMLLPVMEYNVRRDFAAIIGRMSAAALGKPFNLKSPLLQLRALGC
jgi:hypothetical protein